MYKNLSSLTLFILVFIIIALLCRYSVKTSGEIEVKEDDIDNNITNTLVLVNREHGLDKNYIPIDLSIPEIPFTDEAIDYERTIRRINK